MIKQITLVVALFLSITNLTARQIYPLNEGWKFFFATENNADNARQVNIPHVWDSSSSLLKMVTSANYTKEIFAPREWGDKRVFIKFYGVQRVANLLVNGKHVGDHRGGATAFTFEITSFLELGENNAIYVGVNNAPQNDILPLSYEHDISSGIYRDVELIVTPQNAISPTYYGSEGLFVTTDAVASNQASGSVKVMISPKGGTPCRATLTITDPTAVDKVIFKRNISNIDIKSESFEIPFSVKGIKPWSPTTPCLYDFNVTLSSDNQEDQVSVRSGFRTVKVAAQSPLKINDSEVAVKGVTLYHDHPLVGDALTHREYDCDLKLIRELGATAIRSAIYPHDRYLYKECDREGLLVWVDFPFARAPFLSDLAYFPTDAFHNNGRQQLSEIILQNYNHPSVVMWGLFSMLTQRGDDSVEYLKELNTLASRLDPNRPTVAISNQNGDHNMIPDMVVWRQDLGWGRGSFSDIEVWRDLIHSKWSQFTSGVSYGESGAVTDQSDEIKTPARFTSETWFPESRQRAMHEEYAKVLDGDSKFWGVWLNTMFDFGSSRSVLRQKRTGLMTFDRQQRKDVFYLYKALWNKDDPTLHITNRRNRHLRDSIYTLMVYASDTVQIPTATVNGRSYTMRMVAPSQFVADSVIVSAARYVVVEQGNMRDSVEFTYGSPLKPQRY